MDDLWTWGLLGLGAYLLLRKKGVSDCVPPPTEYQSDVEKAAQAVQAALPGASVGQVCTTILPEEHEMSFGENVIFNLQIVNAPAVGGAKPTTEVTFSLDTIRDLSVSELVKMIKEQASELYT